MAPSGAPTATELTDIEKATEAVESLGTPVLLGIGGALFVLVCLCICVAITICTCVAVGKNKKKKKKKKKSKSRQAPPPQGAPPRGRARPPFSDAALKRKVVGATLLNVVTVRARVPPHVRSGTAFKMATEHGALTVVAPRDGPCTVEQRYQVKEITEELTLPRDAHAGETVTFTHMPSNLEVHVTVPLNGPGKRVRHTYKVPCAVASHAHGGAVRAARSRSVEMTANPGRAPPLTLRVGERVQLAGLNNRAMNGLNAVVMQLPTSNDTRTTAGRYTVCLDNNDTVAIKPENLRNARRTVVRSAARGEV